MESNDESMEIFLCLNRSFLFYNRLFLYGFFVVDRHILFDEFIGELFTYFYDESFYVT
ncbi:hypothetical protein QMM44_06520 [Leptospira santarosai]|uniref:hypothetical protein n=1 Tax=Leptospira santarosai TaxID=28183 RepID=UPI000ADD536B|nr:hypothetical protein [Leptospira santarosai]MDI7203105.1 hypothetical protein [Leptospira santarosai]